MKRNKRTIFSNIQIRGVVPGFSLKNLGTILLLPYFITFIFGNLKIQSEQALFASDMSQRLTRGSTRVTNQSLLGKETIPLEIYVADKLARCMDEAYEIEALKAQAVVIRTNLLAEKTENGEILVSDDGYGKKVLPDKIWEATAQSAGVCALVEGQIEYLPYFAISNGATRNGSEVLSADCKYLKSVLCNRDFLADRYNSTISYEKEAFQKIWETIAADTVEEQELLSKDYITVEELTLEKQFRLFRDSVGYALYVEQNGKYVSGEQFREAYELPSDCFHLSLEKGRILITTKGVGHGIGLSQYGANELAKQRKDYIHILETFFHHITITKFE